MNHVLAFYSEAVANTANNTALGVVRDQIIPTPNGKFQILRDARIMGAYVGMPDGSKARIVLPSLTRLFYPQIDPISTTVLPADNPPVIWYDGFGVTAPQTEELSIEVTRAGVGASPVAALVWLGFGQRSKPPGSIFTMRCTSAVTIAAGTWSLGSLVMESSLPAGDYAVVGMSAYGTNLLASRLVFPEQTFRPGVIAQGAQGEFNLPQFRQGRIGEFGRFKPYAQPQIEHLGVGAGAAQVVYLDLVQVSGSAI